MLASCRVLPDFEKSLRKFECLSLRNEINVTNVWKKFNLGKSY